MSIIPSTETPRDEVMANLRRLQREERSSRKKAEKRVAELESQVNALCDSRHEVMEIYAGMEGFIPETDPEAYALKVIEQIYKALLQDKES